MRLEAVHGGAHAILVINHGRESRRMRQTARTNDSPKFMAVLCPSPRDTGWCRWLRDRVCGAKILLPPFLSLD